MYTASRCRGETVSASHAISSSDGAEIERRRRAPVILDWWADVNTQAYKWAHAHLASSSRYMVIRVEDLVSDPRSSSPDNTTEAVTLARILLFVGLTPSNKDVWMKRQDVDFSNLCDGSHQGEGGDGEEQRHRRALFRRHGLGSFPFNGNKLTAELKNGRLRAVGDAGAVALRHFGYDTKSWGLARSQGGAGGKVSADWLEHSAFGAHGSVAFDSNPLRHFYIDLAIGTFLNCPSKKASSSLQPKATSERSNTARSELKVVTPPIPAALASTLSPPVSQSTVPRPPPPSSQVPYALAPGSAREARGQLKGFGEAFGGYGGAPCHRSEEFLSPGPLIIGGVGDSGYGTIGAATRGVESEYM